MLNFSLKSGPYLVTGFFLYLHMCICNILCIVKKKNLNNYLFAVYKKKKKMELTDQEIMS